MNLGEALFSMSWRRFQVLLRGLNPEGALGRRIRKLREEPEEEEEAAAAFFSDMMKWGGNGDERG